MEREIISQQHAVTGIMPTTYRQPKTNHRYQNIMLTFRDFLNAFRKLDLGPNPIIAHASLSAFGDVKGGADTIIGAMLAVYPLVMMPTFTYRTMITPKVGPPDNGITYGTGNETNKMAEFYRPDMPADKLMGIIPDALRQHPKAKRSMHPIYSFSGVNAEDALQAQTLADPFGPIQKLTEARGWVLLLGVGHTTNTSIHYAEQVAGRKQFVRWALTPQGIVECLHWPGCSYGFNQVSPMLAGITREVAVGQGIVQAIPLTGMVEIVGQMIAGDPNALLCDDPGCERCNTIRNNQPEH
jgi:aminoglycoside 3-N-acetyltransferase